MFDGWQIGMTRIVLIIITEEKIKEFTLHHITYPWTKLKVIQHAIKKYMN